MLDNKPTVALQPDEDVTIPRIKLGEVGYIGLRHSGRRILEEQQAAFRYPLFVYTVSEMRNHPTVGAAMNVYKMMMSRVKWDVKCSKSATNKEKKRSEFIKSLMTDMEHSWAEFIESVIPYLEYGFAINEMVFRRRLTRFGSNYNDGLVGIKRLPTRSQDTISGWNFSPDSSELLSVWQTTRTSPNSAVFADRLNSNGFLEMPREKILLFRASPSKGNPEGNSIYKNIYLAFKQLQMLQDHEMIGVAKDAQGMLKIAIPPRYFDPNASPQDKEVMTAFQTIIDNYNMGKQRGLLVPNMIDPESKLNLFTYDLMESKGDSKYDVEAIIKRLQSDILSALSVDILKLGSEGSGSFSLAESKSSILALAIDYRLKEICDVLNSELIPRVYELNGWEKTNMPEFTYSDIEDISLEEFSKAVQRIFAVNAIEVDRPVMNRIRKVFGVEELDDSEEVDVDKLPASLSGMKSRSGDGMVVGTTGDGTSKGGADPGDNTVSNQEK